jgi:hypothetical protein
VCNGPPPAARSLSSSKQGGFVAVDHDRIYWTGDGGVLAAPKGGGAPTYLVHAKGTAGGIAVDSTHVWVPISGRGGAGAWIEKLAKDGSHAEKIGSSKTSLVYAIAVDDSHVYWGDHSAGVIMRAEKSSGKTETFLDLAGDLALDIALTESEVFFTARGPSPIVGKAAKSGGQATVLAKLPGGAPWNLAIAGGDVYWTDPDHSKVVKVPVGGGPTKTVSESLRALDIAADSRAVYFTALASNASTSDGSVWAVLPGIEPAPLVEGLGFDLAGIAVDESQVYYSGPSGISSMATCVTK